MGETIRSRDAGKSALAVFHEPDGGRATCHAFHAAQEATSGLGSAVSAYSDNPEAPAVLGQGPGPLLHLRDQSGDVVFEVAQDGTTTAGGVELGAGGGGGNAVLLTGDQTINGEKVFNDRIPVFPGFDPAFDNQGARKKYVDDLVAAAVAAARPRTADVRITAGDVALATTGSWTVVTSGATALKCAITAAVGDRIHASAAFMRTGSGAFLDLATLTSGGAISRYFGSGTSTPLSEGAPAYYPQASSFPPAPGTVQMTVASGEVDGNGQVSVALVYKAAGAETVYASATYPFYLLLTNLGPVPS